MDGLFAVHWRQSMAAPVGEANGGLHRRRITRHHAVEKCGGGQLRHGALAVRVYLYATCLVSVYEATSHPARWFDPGIFLG